MKYKFGTKHVHKPAPGLSISIFTSLRPNKFTLVLYDIANKIYGTNSTSIRSSGTAVSISRKTTVVHDLLIFLKLNLVG